MADNSTRIVITAEDRASAALGAVKTSLGAVGTAAGALLPQLGALGGAATAGGLAAMVKGTIDAADTLNDLSQRIGIGIKDLAGWTLAANQSGTSIESVAKGVKGLSVYMVEHGEKLRAAGITATDANGALIQLADLFKAMPDGVAKTALAVQLFGKAGMDMIPMLNQGSVGLAEAQEKAAKYGQRMAELAPHADKINDELAEMALHSKALGINITGYLITPLTHMVTAMNDLAAGGERAEKKMAWLADQGHPIAKAVMAWSGVFGAMGLGESRSKGYTGPKNAQGLPMSQEEMFSGATDTYMAQWEARRRAAGLLDKSTSAAGSSAKTPLQRMLEEQQKRIAALNALAGDEQMVSVDSVARQYAAKEAAELEKAGEKIKDSIEPLRVLRREIDEVNRLRAAGLLTAGQASEAEDDLARKFAKSRDAMLDLGKTGKDSFGALTDAIEGWGNKAADTFADFVAGGKASFSDLINSMLKDILRLQAKQMFDPIAKGASGWLGNLAGTLFGGGGVGGRSVQGNADYIWDLHSGGIAGAGEGSGRRLRDLALFAGAPKYHTGGLAGDEMPAILKKGEGVFTPGQMKALGGAAPSVDIQIINQTGQPVAARQQGAPKFDGQRWVIAAVMEAAATDPGFRAAMGLR